MSNGIRLTGMPAYTGSLKENEMWQVSLMLANADKLSTSVQGFAPGAFSDSVAEILVRVTFRS